MAKSIQIPKAIFSDMMAHNYILPIFVHLKIRQGLDGKSYTTLVDIAEACGLTPDKNFKQRPYFTEILSTIYSLYSGELISGIYYTSGCMELNPIKPIKSLEKLKSTQPFMIELTPDMSELIAEGFTLLPFEIYKKLFEISDKNDVTFWRLLSVYCCISKRIYNEHKTLPENPITDEDKDQVRLMATYRPNFWLGSVTRLSSKLECSVSRNTLYEIINLFNENDILHSASAGKFIDADGNPKNVGTVIVRDSYYWETELKGALQMARKRAISFYGGGGAYDEQKGEEVTTS